MRPVCFIALLRSMVRKGGKGVAVVSRERTHTHTQESQHGSARSSTVDVLAVHHRARSAKNFALRSAETFDNRHIETRKSSFLARPT